MTRSSKLQHALQEGNQISRRRWTRKSGGPVFCGVAWRWRRAMSGCGAGTIVPSIGAGDKEGRSTATKATLVAFQANALRQQPADPGFSESPAAPLSEDDVWDFEAGQQVERPSLEACMGQAGARLSEVLARDSSKVLDSESNLQQEQAWAESMEAASMIASTGRIRLFRQLPIFPINISNSGIGKQRGKRKVTGNFPGFADYGRSMLPAPGPRPSTAQSLPRIRHRLARFFARVGARRWKPPRRPAGRDEVYRRPGYAGPRGESFSLLYPTPA